MTAAPTDGEPADGVVEAAVLRLVAERGAGKTICPSEVARHLGGPTPDAWRKLMAPVKRAALRLAERHAVVILRGGQPVDGEPKGIYRIGPGGPK